MDKKFGIAVLEIRQKINWPRFLFELALPSLNRPFKNGHFFFTLSFMINDIVLVANECLECSWLPWQHVDIMNTPSVAQLGTPSPTVPMHSPHTRSFTSGVY